MHDPAFFSFEAFNIRSYYIALRSDNHTVVVWTDLVVMP